MKWVLVLILCSSLARAESRPEALAPLRVDESTLEKAYRRARAKRNIGIALAIPAVTSTLLGVLLIAYAANQEPYINAEIGELVSGSITVAAGLAVGIPGVVLWNNGQVEMDEVKWRRQQLKVTVRPTLSGVVVTF